MKIQIPCRNPKCEEVVTLNRIDGTNNFYNGQCESCCFRMEAVTLK